MAVKKKAGKSPVKTKKPSARPAKKVVAKKPRTKKSVRGVDGTKKTAAAKPATTKKPRAKRKPARTSVAAQSDWRVTLVFGNMTGIYAIANDQRIYRWNTRSAVWVLHKEGAVE